MIVGSSAGTNLGTGEPGETQITCNFPPPPATPHRRRDAPLIYMKLDPKSKYGFDENYDLLKKCVRCSDKPWWPIEEFISAEGERDMCRGCILETTLKFVR